MELTDEQKHTMNHQVKQLPVIQELQEQDKQIMDKLNGLETGQEDIEERLDKGAKRMDGIEGELKEVKAMLRESDTKRDQQHEKIIDKISEKETEKLKSDIRGMMADKKTTEGRIWDILKIFAALMIAAALGYLGIK